MINTLDLDQLEDIVMRLEEVITEISDDVAIGHLRSLASIRKELHDALTAETGELEDMATYFSGGLDV